MVLGAVLVGVFSATPTVAGGDVTASWKILLGVAEGAVEVMPWRCVLYR